MNVIDGIFCKMSQLELRGVKVVGIVISSDVMDEIKAMLPLADVKNFRLFDRPVAVCNSSFVVAFEVEA